ncbi:MAG: hypothetical protein H6854_00445 [Rhodospirillales bacterium]|nr:hypothetical protein [Rhodospirillales bacterium]
MTIASLAFSTAFLLNPIPQQDAPTQTQASPTSEFMVVAHNGAQHGRHFHPGKQGGYWQEPHFIPGDPRHLNFDHHRRYDSRYYNNWGTLPYVTSPNVIIVAPPRSNGIFCHSNGICQPTELLPGR